MVSLTSTRASAAAFPRQALPSGPPNKAVFVSLMLHVTQGLISAPTSASGPWLTPVMSFSSRLWKCKPVKYAPYQPVYLILCLGFEKSALGSSATEGWAVPGHRKWPFNWGAAAFRGSCCCGGVRHDQTSVKGSRLERLWVGGSKGPFRPLRTSGRCEGGSMCAAFSHLAGRGSW